MCNAAGAGPVAKGAQVKPGGTPTSGTTVPPGATPPGAPLGTTPINYAQFKGQPASAVYGAYNNGLPTDWSWDDWLAQQPEGTPDPRKTTAGGQPITMTWNPTGPGYVNPQTNQLVGTDPRLQPTATQAVQPPPATTPASVPKTTPAVPVVPGSPVGAVTPAPAPSMTGSPVTQGAAPLGTMEAAPQTPTPSTPFNPMFTTPTGSVQVDNQGARSPLTQSLMRRYQRRNWT